MAELTQSEFYEIKRRQSQEDFKTLLNLLENDQEIVLVDDPDPAADLVEDEEEDEPVDPEPVDPNLPSVVDEHLTSQYPADAETALAATPESEEELEVEGLTVEGQDIDALADAELASGDDAQADAELKQG